MLIEVKRPYGGAEGKRVKPGTRFWVALPGKGKKPQRDLREITMGRYQQLKGMRLAEPVDPRLAAVAAPMDKRDRQPQRGTAPTPANKVMPDSQPKAPPAPGGRAASKAQSPKTAASKAARPGGGQPGAEDGLQSSSLGGRPTKPSTLKQRGVRRGDRSDGSPSTTPGDSSPGLTASTPATPAGGVSTDLISGDDSTAFA